MSDLFEIREVPLSSRNLNRSGNLWLHVGDPSDPELVRSGHRFIFRTSDPKNFPLPSKELLELQFHLNRVVNMAAAAEGEEEDDYNDSYSDHGGLDSSLTLSTGSASRLLSSSPTALYHLTRDPTPLARVISSTSPFQPRRPRLHPSGTVTRRPNPQKRPRFGSRRHVPGTQVIACERAIQKAGTAMRPGAGGKIKSQ